MLIQVVFALIIALLFSVILIVGVDRRGPGPWLGFLFFFVLLFLSVWAAGIWITPVGPTLWGVSWLTYLLIGLILTLLLAAATPPARRPSVPAPKRIEETEAAKTSDIAFTIFFWILVVVLLASILSRYAWAV